jgi:hypothetical protein
MDLEQYLVLPVLAAVLIAAVVVAAWLFIRSTEQKTFPIACMLIGFCVEALFVRQPYVTIVLQIYLNDVISLFLLASTAGSLMTRRIPVGDLTFLAWLGFGAMAMLSFAIGIGEYGRYAGTEFRPFFYLWIAGTYGCLASLDDDDLRQIGRWCTWAAYAFIGISLMFLVGLQTGLIDRSNVFDFAVGGRVFRPIGSHATFFVAMVGLVQLMAWLRGSGTRWSGTHALLFLLLVVLMQHRSVWVATGFGLMIVLWLERRHVTRHVPFFLWSALAIAPVLAVAVWAGVFDELIERLVTSAVTMFDSQGTFAARVDGWDRLVETWTEAGGSAIAIGLPFGHGYTRLFRGQLIEFAPHNWFLDLVLRVGVIGLLFYVWAAVAVMIKAMRAPATTEFEVLLLRGVGVALAASLLYYLAYPSYYLIGAAIGIATGYLARAPKPVVAAPPLAPETVAMPRQRRSPWRRAMR